ncbi:unnamed protein product, partial [Mesorhabditis belari]|uniref:Alpha/beta hydrolase fold-3 domain-containing protein n=1 Tax=Mesorhabditis belari TaxID=2138241 RepID=A0AAF3FKD3_9BILA
MKDTHGRRKGFILTAFLVSLIAWTLYKPLPEDFTEKFLDKFTMHLIEPALRVTYYWPADKLCPNAACRLTWTRLVLNSLARTIDPRILFDSHPDLKLATEFFDNIEVRTYIPKFNRTTDGAVFFVHGGGFVLGNTAIYEGLMRRMAKMLGSVVISVNYRLAPETIYPGGLEDVERALIDFIDNSRDYGVDPDKIVIMGDSAGGNLIAATAQRLRAKPEYRLAGQVLLYPLLQFHNLQTQSFLHFHRDLNGYALVDPTSLAYYYMWYAGIDVSKNPELAHSAITNGHLSDRVQRETSDIFDFSSLPKQLDHKIKKKMPMKANREAMLLMEEHLLDPSFAPLVQRNLTNLPTTLIVTCQFDILRDEGVLYHQRLVAAGISSKWIHYEKGFHAMLNFHNELYLAQESLKEIVDWTLETIKQV